MTPNTDEKEIESKDNEELTSIDFAPIFFPELQVKVLALPIYKETYKWPKIRESLLDYEKIPLSSIVGCDPVND
jgi:hypothetical protein